MTLRTLKGYVMVILSGLLLSAAALLVILQWGRVSGFSLFGYPYEILVMDGKVKGGVNTALLMIISAVCGILAVLLVKMLVAGSLILRKRHRQEEQKQVAERLAKLEKSQQETPAS